MFRRLAFILGAGKNALVNSCIGGIDAEEFQHWEQECRQPDAPAAAYLHAIALRSREISEALKL